MTIVAWDGKTLAADKQSTCAGLRFTTTKLWRSKTYPELWLAGTGDLDVVLALGHWYDNGALVEAWPKVQEDKDLWSRLIIGGPDGVIVYERQPFALKVADPFMAWGSGRDYAMGAMARGATAREAVEIACRFDTGCGMGVDAADIRTGDERNDPKELADQIEKQGYVDVASTEEAFKVILAALRHTPPEGAQITTNRLADWCLLAIENLPDIGDGDKATLRLIAERLRVPFLDARQVVLRHRRHVELSPGVGEEAQKYALSVCDDILSDLPQPQNDSGGWTVPDPEAEAEAQREAARRNAAGDKE